MKYACRIVHSPGPVPSDPCPIDRCEVDLAEKSVKLRATLPSTAVDDGPIYRKEYLPHLMR
jgi:hypothetical protein